MVGRYSVAVIGFLAGFLPFTLQAQQAESPDGLAVLAALQERMARLVAQAEPAVVSVIRIKSGEPTAARPFGGFPGAFPTNARGSVEELLNNPNVIPNDFGSGVIIDSEGFVLTAYHVVRGARTVVVRFQDGSAVAAELWAADPRSDLAVLRVPRAGLVALPMGNADQLRKGHIVLALANPFATARDGRATVSFGIVANTRRSLPPPENPLREERTLHHNGTLIQTDCRIDIGSSGGALIDLHGRLVGILTALPALHGYDQPAGFAIPINSLILRIIERLKEGREVEYGFLGIQLENVQSLMRRAAGVDVPPHVRHGVVVMRVYPACPAYLAGLRERDIIIAIDDELVRNTEELIVKIGARFAGTRTRLRIIRNGREREVVVKLGKYPLREKGFYQKEPDPWRGIRVDWASLVINEIMAQERLARVKDGAVLAREVLPKSPAAAAGLQAGTLITHVDSKPVRDPDEFREAVRNKTGPVELTLENGERIVVPPATGER